MLNLVVSVLYSIALHLIFMFELARYRNAKQCNCIGKSLHSVLTKTTFCRHPTICQVSHSFKPASNNNYKKVLHLTCGNVLDLNSGVARGEGAGGSGILDELYVIICLNYIDQLLLGYIAYLLIAHHLTVLPSAQAQSYGNGPLHLVYALVYSRLYKKDLIIMCIMSQLGTVFFFVFAAFESLTLSVRMQYRHYRQYYASDMGARTGGTVPFSL